MPLYAGPADMLKQFGENELIQLSSSHDAPNEVDACALRTALERASVEIDGYIASRYPRPFDPVPRILVGLCCDLTRYRLAGAGGRLVTDEMRDRHKDAISMLKMIARGEVKLGADRDGKLHEFRDGIRIVKGSSGALSDALRDFPA